MPDMRPTPGADLAKVARNLSDTRLVLQRGAKYVASSDWVIKNNVTVIAEGTGGPIPEIRFAGDGAGIHLLGSQNVALADMAVVSTNPKPTSSGVRAITIRNIRLRGLRVTGFRNGISCEGSRDKRSLNFWEDNCYVHNNFAFDQSNHSQGTFISYTDGARLLRNVFDTNGWTPGKGIATQWNHNAYLHGSNGPIEVTGNLFYNGAATGCQHRCGGDNTYNLYLTNPMGLTYGLVNGEGPLTQGGVSGTLHHLAFVGGRDINGSPRGAAMTFGNIKSAVARDILISDAPQDKFAAIAIEACRIAKDSPYLGKPGGLDVGILDLILQRVFVWDWPKGPFLQSTSNVKQLSKPAQWAPPREFDLRNYVESQQVLAKARAGFAAFDAKPWIDGMFAGVSAGPVAPTPVPPPATVPAVLSLLVNAVKLDGTTIGKLNGSAQLAPVAAVAVPSQPVDSVKFSLDRLGDEKPPLLQTEQKSPPLAFPGDTDGVMDNYPWASGAYRLTVLAFKGGKQVASSISEFSVYTPADVAGDAED